LSRRAVGSVTGTSASLVAASRSVVSLSGKWTTSTRPSMPVTRPVPSSVLKRWVSWSPVDHECTTGSYAPSPGFASRTHTRTAMLRSVSCRASSPRLLVLVLLASVCIPPPAARAQDDDRPDLLSPDELIVRVVPGGETITLDGVLDEAVWQQAVPATGFWQYAPLDRVPATEHTEVRVAQDDRAIYFGVICRDTNPK